MYIKLGKRFGLTVHQQGHPTKTALKTRYREYEQRLDFAVGYLRPPMYSRALKKQTVEHCLLHGSCIAATIKVRGYSSRSFLSVRVRELHPQDFSCVFDPSQELPSTVRQAAFTALSMRQASAKAVDKDFGVSRGSRHK